MDSVTALFLRALVIIGLVLMNGFFVAAEFAIVKVRSTQIEVLLKQGSWRASLARNVVRHLDVYLSATQLGITISSLALGWIGEPFVSHYLRPVLLGAGITSTAVVESLSLVIAFFFITFLHIVFGELAPKSLAIRKPQQTTMWIAAPLMAFYKVLFPFIWLLNHAANWALRLIGIKPVSESEAAHSKEELQMLFVEAHAEKRVSALVKRMLVNALDLRTRKVSEILTPRPKVVFLSVKNSPSDNFALADTSGYSRFPLCDGDLDHAIGMVHIKDLVHLQQQPRNGLDLLSIKRDVIFVPEATVLESLLANFLKNRCHMAIVIDEYGGTAGIVTLEDIFEELVGEIQDEFDQELPRIEKVGDSEFLVDGAITLHDLETGTGLSLQSSRTTTLSGYLIECLGRTPVEGDTLKINSWQIEVRKVRKHRILQVHLVRSASN